MSDKPREQWGSRIGLILAMAGNAVGLGNFLRFPRQAVENGGGTFMIPYFVAFLLVGIPLMWIEWGVGRHGGLRGHGSVPGMFESLWKNPVAKYMGVLGLFMPLVVLIYYCYIESWTLAWTFFSLTGATQGLDQDGMRNFLSSYQNLGDPSVHAVWTPFLFFFITLAVNIAVVMRGLSAGIEKLAKIGMPILFIFAAILVVRVLTLPANAVADAAGCVGAAAGTCSPADGLNFMYTPDWGALGNAKVWLAAAGQIFFSLSVGFGVIINYASYMKKKDDVVLSGLTASATNELFEVGFGGMITLTASFVFLGLSGTIAAVQGGTFGLGFSTLPVVFAQMGPFGNFIGAVWFFMLFLAAITSSISMYQPALAFFQEALGTSRKNATTLMVVICVIGSFLVMYFSKGAIFQSTVDDWVGTFLIFVMAMVQIICFSWVFGIERGWKEAHEGAHIRIPGFYKIIMKYVAPLYLIIVFVAFCVQNLPSWVRSVAEQPERQGAIALIVAVTIFICVCVAIGTRRWRAAGLDIDGREPIRD